MGERRQYNVTINGHDTVLNLTAEDAEKLYPGNATPVEDGEDTTSKARTTANKSRAAAENK